MKWNLRMRAAQAGIWKSTEIRLDDLEVICAVLDCTPADLLICEPGKVAARRPPVEEATPGSVPAPRLGRHTSVPPA